MIEVRRRGKAWVWSFRSQGTCYANAVAYPSAAHALRDAHTWTGGTWPALIFMGPGR